jgi:citrate lyase subunit beta/citryl-CoA lyase
VIVRRSVLIVPANVPRFVERAHLRGADAVMLDLEDSIPAGEKEAARLRLAEAARAVGRGGADVLVRVNKPFELLIDDLDAAVVPGVGAIGLPKAESGREVAVVDALLRERELRLALPPGGIGLAVTVESAVGLGRLDEILGASERIQSVDLGVEDLSRDLEIEPTPEGRELLLARQMIVLAARRAGVEPLGLATTLANFGDVEALRASATQAREMGFRGASCIHPSQVAHLNELFSPAPEAVEKARRILEAYDEAVAAGRASAGLDGQMIDVPVAERARRLLGRAEAVAERERRKHAALAVAAG